MSKTKPINPFYVVLVVVGIAFCLTAACYMLLLLRVQQPDLRTPIGSDSGRGLLAIVERYGNWIFLGELAVLAVATVGAITTDRYWMRRAIRRRAAESGTAVPSQATAEISEKTS